MTTAPAQAPAFASVGRHNGSALPGFDPRLEPIADKIARGERLTVEDGILLYETPDIWTVCSLADQVRRRLHGDIAFYNVNRHINYSNVCALSCTFCSFYRKKGDDGAYEMTVDDVVEQARGAAEAGATEVHIVGGLHPWLPFSYYTDMLSAIREATPRLHIKAFTAVEIVHLARISKRGREGYDGMKAVLQDLMDAGLGSLPGGGAEVFDDRVHDEAFKGKIRAGTWLDVHRAAHELGLNTNATMLYGHVETRADRVRHLDVLRKAQDEAVERHQGTGEGIKASRHQGIEEDARSTTLDVSMPLASMPSDSGYFQTIIPLPFFPDDAAIEHLPAPTGLENLRTIAICRLMLDNVPHIKAFWIMQSLGMAQFMLQNGADDLDGTVVWYDITKLSGAGTHQETTVFDLQRAIREAGFRPVERDTLYRPVIRDGATWRVDD